MQQRVAAAEEAGRQDIPTTSGLEEISKDTLPIEDFSGSMSLFLRDHRFEPAEALLEDARSGT